MILIYELTNYLINFLKEPKLEGIDDVLQFSQQELQKISHTMKALQNLKKDANSPDNNIHPSVKDKIIPNLNDREKSLIDFQMEWDEYIKKIREVQDNVGKLVSHIPSLELIRDNVKNQLAFFEIMNIFGIMMIAEAVRNSLKPLEIDPLPLSTIDVISLPPHKVRTLIGLSQE
jgi:hypothetical protein